MNYNHVFVQVLLFLLGILLAPFMILKEILKNTK